MTKSLPHMLCYVEKFFNKHKKTHKTLINIIIIYVKLRSNYNNILFSIFIYMVKI